MYSLLVGDSAQTRERILRAAVAEFAAYGIAGARVDRIAAAAGCNKSMIFTYYQSKDKLFDAVFDTIVVKTVDAVPMNAADLPDYAARLFDQHQLHPEVVRIGTFDRLERHSLGMGLPAVQAASRQKSEAISRAQRDGLVTTRYPAAALLELIVALSQIPGHPQDTPDIVAARRRTVFQAVRDLTRAG